MFCIDYIFPRATNCTEENSLRRTQVNGNFSGLSHDFLSEALFPMVLYLTRDLVYFCKNFQFRSCQERSYWIRDLILKNDGPQFLLMDLVHTENGFSQHTPMVSLKQSTE